ncbi:Unknown protein [Striga hermonthica]|uniref:NAC domain-containing protein n=1 Tax=Striga hermonthica TaxID=68872 RepID=A0A9N7MU77_STRHE|nr:Unknown protein [Striga hermonthica]
MGGIKFKLRDADCCDYLLGFVKGNPLPSHGFTSIADLYSQTEPWELFEDSQVKDSDCRYFFTELKKVDGKKGRSYQCYSRNVGAGGNWESSSLPRLHLHSRPLRPNGALGVVRRFPCKRRRLSLFIHQTQESGRQEGKELPMLLEERRGR